MKRMFWIAALLIVAVAVVLTGCARRTPSEVVEADGGVQNDTSYDAPKTIESTQIIAFSCEFSGFTMDEKDTRLAGQAFQLEAKLENGAVKGSYHAYTRYDGEKKPFRASHSFMDALQKVVAEHDLAQHNGLSYRVSGLPEGYGATLSVTYASGESIHASNNQSCFLSIDAMEALEALFYAQIEPYPTPLDLSIAEEFTMEDVNGCFLSIRYPVLTLGHPHWDGTYRNGQGHDALDAALDAYNMEIRMDQEAMLKYTLRPAAEQMTGDGTLELYSLADVYVTRSDDRVISFYEARKQYTGLIGEQQFRKAFNFDVKTGKKLAFADVFTDVNNLPDLLAEAFAAADPSLDSADGLAAQIGVSIQEEDGIVCYALAKGGVHFFAEKNPLGGPVGIVHVMDKDQGGDQDGKHQVQDPGLGAPLGRQEGDHVGRLTEEVQLHQQVDHGGQEEHHGHTGHAGDDLMPAPHHIVIGNGVGVSGIDVGDVVHQVLDGIGGHVGGLVEGEVGGHVVAQGALVHHIVLVVLHGLRQVEVLGDPLTAGFQVAHKLVVVLVGLALDDAPVDGVSMLISWISMGDMTCTTFLMYSGRAMATCAVVPQPAE